MKHINLLLIGAAAVLAVAVGLVVLSPGAGATNDPPDTGGTVTGDWTVTDYRSYSWVSINIEDGNLWIDPGGTLSLTGVYLTFTNTDPSSGNYTLGVEKGGVLQTGTGCTITSSSGSVHYSFYIKGSATLSYTVISEMWGDTQSWVGGVQLYSDSASITNCTITRGMTGGISIFDCSPYIAYNNIERNGQDGQCPARCYGVYAHNSSSVLEYNTIQQNTFELVVSQRSSYTLSKSPTSGIYWNGNYYSGWYYAGYVGGRRTYYGARYDYNYYYSYSSYEYYGTGLFIDGGSAVRLSYNRVDQNGYGTAGYSSYSSGGGYTLEYWYLSGSYRYEYRYYVYTYQYTYKTVRCRGEGLHVEDSSVVLEQNSFDRNGFEPRHTYTPNVDNVGWYEGVAVNAFRSELNLTLNTINNAATLVNLTLCRANFTQNSLFGDFIGGGSYSTNMIPSGEVFGIRCNRSVVANLLGNSITLQYRDYPNIYVPTARPFAYRAVAVDLGEVTVPVLIQGNTVLVASTYYGCLGAICINTTLGANLTFLDNSVEYRRSSNIAGWPDKYALVACGPFDILIDNCTLKGPQAGNPQAPPVPSSTPKIHGVVLSGTPNLSIFNSTIQGFDWGVEGPDVGSCAVQNVKFTACGFGLTVPFCKNLDLSSSTFSGCGFGVASSYGTDLDVSASQFQTCTCGASALYAVELDMADVLFSGCTLGLQASYATVANLFNVTLTQCSFGVQLTDFSRLSLDQGKITASKTFSLVLDRACEASIVRSALDGASGGLQAIGSRASIGNCSFSHPMEFMLDSAATVEVFNTTHTRGAVTVLDRESILDVYWPIHIDVRWQNEAPARDVAVVLATLLGQEVFSGTTDEEGSPGPKLWVREYTARNQAVTTFNPHRITASKGRAVTRDLYMIDQPLDISFHLVDNVPPDLSILYPLEGQMLTGSRVTFRGLAEDPEAGIVDGYVYLSIDDQGWIAVEIVDGRWNLTRLLDDGTHLVRLRAEDIARNIARTSLRFTQDTRAPVLYVFSPADGSCTNQRTIAVTGVTEEKALLTVNGIAVSLENRHFSAQVSLDNGPNIINVTTADRSGNSRTALLRVTLDMVPPFLEVRSPLPGESVNRAIISVTGTTEPSSKVLVNAVEAPVRGSLFELLVGLSEGVNTILITAEDAAGNRAVRTLSVHLDTALPELTVFTPHDGLRTNRSRLLVSGATEQGASIIVNGQHVNVMDALFSCPVNLLEGANRILIVARDAAGNVRTVTRIASLDTRAPDLVVTSPYDGEVLSTRIVMVSGSVDWGAEVLVNGEPVPVKDFVFLTAVRIPEDGTFTIEVVASDQAGNTAVATRSVRLDTTTPAVTITFPEDNTSIRQRMVTVTGQTEPFATVVINSETVVVVGRDCLFQVPVLLEDGENRITVRATDAAGNSATESVTVVKLAPAAAESRDQSWVFSLSGLLVGAGLMIPLMAQVLLQARRRQRAGVLAEVEAAEIAREERQSGPTRLPASPKTRKVVARKTAITEPPKQKPPEVLPEAPRAEEAAPGLAKAGLKDKSGATEVSPDETDPGARMGVKAGKGPMEETPVKAEAPEPSLRDKGGEAEGEPGETEVGGSTGGKR